MILHVFRAFNLVIIPPALHKSAGDKVYVVPMFFKLYFLVIFVRPIISTSTRPIFTKFAGLVELWPADGLKLFFGENRHPFCGRFSSRDIG